MFASRHAFTDCMGVLRHLGLLHSILILTCCSRVMATPTPTRTLTPTRTPGPLVIQGVVMRPDNSPVSDTAVDGFFCGNRATCLSDPPAGLSTVTGAAGSFSLSFPEQAAPVVIVTATVDGVDLRGFGTAD